MPRRERREVVEPRVLRAEIRAIERRLLAPVRPAAVRARERLELRELRGPVRAIHVVERQPQRVALVRRAEPQVVGLAEPQLLDEVVAVAAVGQEPLVLAQERLGIRHVEGPLGLAVDRRDRREEPDVARRDPVERPAGLAREVAIDAGDPAPPPELADREQRPVHRDRDHALLEPAPQRGVVGRRGRARVAKHDRVAVRDEPPDLEVIGGGDVLVDALDDLGERLEPRDVVEPERLDHVERDRVDDPERTERDHGARKSGSPRAIVTSRPVPSTRSRRRDLRAEAAKRGAGAVRAGRDHAGHRLAVDRAEVRERETRGDRGRR